MFSSSMGLDRSDTSTCRLSAKDTAALTRPSSSAPLKFFVVAARATRHQNQDVSQAHQRSVSKGLRHLGQALLSSSTLLKVLVVAALLAIEHQINDGSCLQHQPLQTSATDTAAFTMPSSPASLEFLVVA